MSSKSNKQDRKGHNAVASEVSKPSKVSSKSSSMSSSASAHSTDVQNTTEERIEVLEFQKSKSIYEEYIFCLDFSIKDQLKYR